jgi:GNAT superfamily N-acetyltransferase
MSLEVRAAALGDADDLGALHVAAWRAAYRGLMSDEFLASLAVEASRARWRQWLSGRELPLVRVAVRDGVLAGFCTVAVPSRDPDADEGVAEIAALNVAPAHWGTGVGSALMRDALEGLQLLAS